MYGTALGIGNPNAYAAQPVWGASPIGGQVTGVNPFGWQPQQYGQQSAAGPFGVAQQLATLPAPQQIAQLLQLVSQQLQQLQRLEYFQQQQQVQLQQLLQFVPQQLQQIQQTIQILSHQIHHLQQLQQQQSPALQQPLGQTAFGPLGLSGTQPGASSFGWYGGQGLVN